MPTMTDVGVHRQTLDQMLQEATAKIRRLDPQAAHAGSGSGVR